MKIYLSVYELWLWRVSIIFLLFISVINYLDNRQQDHLIFKTIDIVDEDATQMTEIINQINGILETDIIQNIALIKLLK